MNLSPELQTEAEKALQAINEATNILLHLHPTPDGDSFGSALAMFHYLKSINKKVTLIKGDSPLPLEFEALLGYEDITPKNYFEIDLSQFNLFIILDSAHPLFISQIREVNFPSHLKTIVVDHHATNKAYGDINVIDRSAPATAQIVFNLFKIWNLEITADIAICLYTGIYTDTGGFQYSGVTRDTFLIAAELYEINPNINKILQKILNSKPIEKIKFIGVALKNLRVLFKGKLAMTEVNNEELIENKIPKEYIRSNGLVSHLRSIRGVEVSFTAVEKEPGLIKLSLRSVDGDKFDVSKVAEIMKAGGGHKAATGIEIKGDLKDISQRVIDILANLYPGLKT